MQHTRARTALAGVALLALVATAAACGDDDGESTATTAAPAATTAAPAATTAAPAATTAAPATAGAPLVVDTATCTAPTAGTKVKLQLQWFTQAQFGGYFAAVEEGYYAAENLDVEIIEAALDTLPAKVLAEGNADFAISWVPKALQLREGGAQVTDIAQVFQRSPTLQVSFKDKNITKAADFKGKKIGTWGFGNEYEVFAGLTQAGLTPNDVTLIQQDFNMNALLDGSIDAAEAMTYNEYAQVLEAKNPATGELYKPEDFNVVSYEKEGAGMLQDAIWADQAKLSDPVYCGTAIAFVKASIKGWAYCRDNAEACRDIVVAKGSKLGASHQLWQMNEVNGVIWPATAGAGTIDEGAWARTVGIASGTKNLDGATVLTKPVTDGAWTNDIVKAAQAALTAEGIDINGSAWTPITVTLNEGGA